jgi:cation diffusion facilitator family transporter
MAGDSNAASALAERNEARIRIGLRAVSLSFASNLALIFIKAAAGVIGHSQGLVADAIHSGADLVNSGSVIASLFVSRKPADLAHPYGHGRAEALAAIVASFIIATAGLAIAWDAITVLRSGRTDIPSALTLWVALGALLVKFALFAYEGRIARQVKSKSVLADAREQLTDALASAVVIVGIVGARIGYPQLDTMASLLVSGFILYTAYEVFFDAAEELMDTSLSQAMRDEILESVAGATTRARVTGVAGRSLANTTVIEIHIDVDPTMTVGEGAAIADGIKQTVLNDVPTVTNVIVEMNSAMDEPHRI